MRPSNGPCYYPCMVAAESPDLDEVGAEGDECAVGLGFDVGEAEVEDHLVMV